MQLGIGDPIDLAHSTLAYEVGDLIVPEAGADFEGRQPVYWVRLRVAAILPTGHNSFRVERTETVPEHQCLDLSPVNRRDRRLEDELAVAKLEGAAGVDGRRRRRSD